MERIVYLLLTIPFLVFVGIIYAKRPDLRRFIIKVGILGGFIGIFSEIWYFQDYWRPITIFGGIAVPSVEDFLFGAGVVALGATVGLFFTKQKQTPRASHSRRRLVVLALLIILAQILFVNILHINSIVSSFIIFSATGVWGLVKSPHLLKAALISGVILVVVAAATYAVLFLVIDPTYIQKYFLLFKHPLVPTFFGFMPVTELIWYFTWGISATVLHDIIRGTQKPKAEAPTTSKLTS